MSKSGDLSSENELVVAEFEKKNHGDGDHSQSDVQLFYSHEIPIMAQSDLISTILQSMAAFKEIISQSICFGSQGASLR